MFGGGGLSTFNHIPLINVIMCLEFYGDNQVWMFLMFPGGLVKL